MSLRIILLNSNGFNIAKHKNAKMKFPAAELRGIEPEKINEKR